MESTEIITSSEKNAQLTIEKAQPAISHITGIIHHVSEIMVEPNDPKLFHIGAKLAETSRVFEYSAYNKNGGVGLTKSVATAAAIGECFERYCMSFVDREHLILSSAKRLNKEGLNVVNPSDFALFSKKQYSKPNFPFKEFTEDSKVNWIWGYSLVKQKPILVPAFLVYIPYEPINEDLIAYSISTGTSCARSKEEATLKAIYEVVERDSVMITWLNRLVCPLIDVSSCDYLSQIFSEKFLPTGLKFYVANITLDIPIPTLFSIIIDDLNEGLSVSVGAATNLDPQAAALKSLMECAQTRLWLKHMKLVTKEEYI